MSFAERFFNIYRGLDRARGKNKTSTRINAKGKRESTNQTLHETYNVECWEKHLAGTEGLGVVPINDDGMCVWGAIDVDIYPLDLIELEQKVKALALPFVVLKTKSGGAHLTAFWKDWVSCAEVRAKMAEASFALDLGEREFYPKQVKLANKTDIGNWLNMPYFCGDDTERYAIKDGKQLTAFEFLEYAESMQLEMVTDFVVPATQSEIEDGPPCLQSIIRQKAGQGERNNVLFNLGVYARVKFESTWEDELNNFNHNFIVPPLNHREVGAIVKSLEKKNYSYTCNNTPLCNNCNRETCKSREFGIHAFQHIDVGIALDSVTKMNSQPPMWILSLEGVRTEIETEDLLNQDRFKVVCVNAINKIPGRMKNEDWDKFIRNKLSTIEIIEMPRETRMTDRVEDHLPRFFAMTPPAKAATEIRLGRWMAVGDNYLFRGVDFMNFLERQNMKIDPRKIWVVMTDLGVTLVREGSEVVWCVPNTIYDPRSKERKLAVPDRGSDHEDF